MKSRTPGTRARLTRRRVHWERLLPFALLALVLHAVGLVVVAPLIPKARPLPMKPAVVELVQLAPMRDASDEEPEEEEELEEEEEKDFDGQIVEIAPPEEKEKPDEADYLAEFDQKVDEETRADRFKINPEVLAKQYSEEEKVEIKAEDVPDMQMTDPASGATVGSERFEPGRDGTLASVPSKWQATNKDGFDNPVPASALQSVLAGAPQNDRLDEKKAKSTSLNTKEFQYASYLLTIRRMVNFYWNQNLENLPSSVRLAKPEYTTTVQVVLNGNGTLETIGVAGESGSVELDDCVVRAFQVAGPYPKPPEGLLEKDGRAYLPDMKFTVVLGVAQMKYEGIDPRAGVQFPGILKSPR